MLFCDSRGQWFAWLVNLTAVAVYSLFPYFWCPTVESIQFHVACCTAVSCSWRLTNFSLFHLLPQSCPKCLPAKTCRIVCVILGCVVLPSTAVYCAPNFKDMLDCMFLYCITISFLILAPIILPFHVHINHVKYYINTVDINTNYVFLSEYCNWTADSTSWRELLHMWRVWEDIFSS